MGLPRSILARNNHIECIMTTRREKVFYLLVHLVYKTKLINVFLRVFFVVDFSLDDHRIVAQLEIVLRSYNFSTLHNVFVLRVDRFKDWNAD